MINSKNGRSTIIIMSITSKLVNRLLIKIKTNNNNYRFYSFYDNNAY